MMDPTQLATLETARVSAANANSTAQYLRQRLLQMTGALERQGQVVQVLQAQVRALEARVAALEERLS